MTASTSTRVGKPPSNRSILGLSPFDRPDPRLVLALLRAGAVGVLDLGRDATAARAALARVERDACAPFGVRIPTGVELDPYDLPPGVELVILDAGGRGKPSLSGLSQRSVLVQVTTLDEARAAVEAGADGVIAKGSESGGRIGEETAFVLLQRLVDALDVPVWVQGGVGLHTAAACVAGGAAGFVLDAQLALVRESTLPEVVKNALRTMDGSETVVVAGHRVYSRPGLPLERARLGAPLDEPEADALRARFGGEDLERYVLPAGQDAAFARPLAERFRTAGGVVHAIKSAVEGHMSAARAHEPLAPASPLARERGVRFPIVQGPMTRVSDRAAFADAVSRAGAMPFLALSLLRGDEVRALLTETREMLGERPFGVGILGFVPEDLRDEQLAVLRDMRPAAAIIAGGRPSRARPLEEQGTLTYLHVPSPGLLDLFLKDGARRFVFEGRECGGHVGPRTSFVLWELAVERLLAVPDPAELSVLFAGGIHDARSAAMVSAMAAPLSARGARVGVLLGTAYLFTEEAVTSGAIEPGFQAAALACEKTVLLETAPGHSTRCVDSAYVRAFREEKARLEAEHKSHEEIWAELEKLNLGRLRIAAKGVQRSGDALVRVDEATQAREGMFMIGQLAALRGSTLSMLELHRDVSEGAAARIEALVPEAEMTAVGEAAAEKRPPADVAIVGIACVFPDAPDRHAYWANIVSGKASVVEVPKERWDSDVYYDAASTNGEKTPSKWGGFLPAVPFDPLAYGIPPRSLGAIEPVQLLALEVAKRALDDAGYGDRPFDRERTSVIFGAEAGTELSSAYGFRAFWPQYAGALPPALDAHLPSLTEDSFPGVLANVIAGRIANRLDLGGVNYTVDAACAASLAAVDLAVKELVTGTSDMVLCGGADVHNSINDYLLFASVHALSPTGACRAFDAAADGIVLGEGVACVVLKRLVDAERDGDRVYAVIKGIAGGSDGKSLGLTAPRKEGQVRALDRAYRAAGVSPADVGLVEAHGTGTVVGDRTELATLSEVYLRAGAGVGSVALGSVKSQIGHTKCAAGIAGLVKMALALHHRVLPPTLHIKRFNPGYDATTSPFVFGDAARPWPRDDRRAAVSAFGFGGTNFHAVLAAYDGADAPASGLAVWPAELFLFRARDAAAAGRQMEALERFLDDPSMRLADLARSVSERRRRDDGEIQLALVATSKEDLRAKLAAAKTLVRGRDEARRIPGVFLPVDAARRGKTAFLFPGQGSQRPGMLADLFIAFPALQRLLAAGERWTGRIFPPLATTPEARSAQARALTDTRVAQPALGIASLALAELLRGLDVRPDMLAGHSYGELAALAFAGALEPADLFELSEARGSCILAAAGDDPGTMAAVSAPAARVAALLEERDGVVVANLNAPDQSVISGPTAGVHAAVARLEAAGMTAQPIAVACAFHSPLVAGASQRFAERLEPVPLAPPRIPVFSNATAAAYPSEPSDIRRMLAEHVALPVRFAAEIEAMYAAGARVFVETGPGRVLTGLVGKILGTRPHVAVACDQRGEPGLLQLLLAVAELAVSGVAIDAAPLFAGRDAKKIDVESATPGALAPSTWFVDGHLARPMIGETPKGALRPTTGPVVSVGTGDAVVLPAADREATVLEFLRSTREIVEAQRQVMLGYLGEAPGATASMRASVPPLPSFSPPAMSLPPASLGQPPSIRPSAPPSIRPSVPPSRAVVPASLAPRAARLPGESVEWMRELGSTAGAPTHRSPAAAGAPRDIQETLLSIVSERTGYPVEMLGLDLNLEAELSIDSIKRIEILGTLANELGIQVGAEGQRDAALEKLATLKTLRAIVEWLEKHQADAAAGAESTTRANGEASSNGAAHASPVQAAQVAEVNGADAAPETPRSTVRLQRTIRRYVLAPVDAPLGPGSARSLSGQTWAIAPDRSGVAQALAALLATRGATAVVLDGSPTGALMPPGAIAGLVDLTPLSPDGPAQQAEGALFERCVAALAAGATTLVAVTQTGAPLARENARPRPGVAGLLRTIARERDVAARAVALDPREPARVLADQLVAELSSRDPELEVSYVGGVRKALAPTLSERSRAHASRKNPGLDLGPDSVVVVTGGARGITAAVACALAKRFACRFELVGRSALPVDAEPAFLADAADRLAIRRAFIARGELKDPAAIEAATGKVVAAREIRATLAAMTQAGARVLYHAVDVRDPRALGAFIDDVYKRHGRIDGVVHGAGVLEDRHLADKTRASFDRVFDTKARSARALLEKLRPDTRFVAFFASVSGVFGNKGQVDYSAANDALDKLSWWQSEHTACRVLSVDWGPWAGAGMVHPELAREYARRGVELIEPAVGALAFVDELLDGTDPQVILMSADPSALTASPRAAAADAAGAAVVVDG